MSCSIAVNRICIRYLTTVENIISSKMAAGRSVSKTEIIRCRFLKIHLKITKIVEYVHEVGR